MRQVHRPPESGSGISTARTMGSWVRISVGEWVYALTLLEAVKERESRRVQQLTVQGREWSVSLVNCED
jgi:prophage tail gpP-like protein